MTSNKEISAELLSLSPTLAAIPNTNVFSVPDNYFNELPANVLQLLQPDQPLSFSKAATPAMSVPEGYFDGLASSILNKIKSQAEETVVEEISSLSPAIAAIGKRNVFTVPEGYFDGISSEALKNIAPQAKVVQLKANNRIIRYMAAAVVAGVIGLSIFNLAGNKSQGKVNGYEAELMAEANTILKNKTFDKELNSLSDKDIEQYLTDNGENVDAALVASTVVDDTNLPSAEEYIIDDNTLDNFLKKVNLNN
ncbi:hypothetical protein [Ferruginibacter sp. HRS2-29]|uniref:hypothetical protein n=1 Tax=Ferruginibacter sp. HRS2-29 TaxID=2487334 RepID=UPI0020CC61DE|nr:hypothetical protein [Ferruginibacter sp. HRS2-29]MCP9750519.1 hypothetical protein [Ferruginibacter sp. HRS2-29]